MAAVTDDTATKGGQTNESWLLSASDDKLNKRRRIQSVVLKENGNMFIRKNLATLENWERRLEKKKDGVRRRQRHKQKYDGMN